MTKIRSLDELVHAREQAAYEMQKLSEAKPFAIRVGMSSCSIAAGAGDTYEAIQSYITKNELPGIIGDQISLTMIGCNGMCALEPIIQVRIPGHQWVTYGRVTPDAARKILEDHIGKNIVVDEYRVDSIY